MTATINTTGTETTITTIAAGTIVGSVTWHESIFDSFVARTQWGILVVSPTITVAGEARWQARFELAKNMRWTNPWFKGYARIGYLFTSAAEACQRAVDWANQETGLTGGTDPWTG